VQEVKEKEHRKKEGKKETERRGLAERWPYTAGAHDTDVP